MLVLWMLSFNTGKTASYPILLVVLIFPVLTVMYIRKRQHQTNEKRREVFKKENTLINHVIHSVSLCDGIPWSGNLPLLNNDDHGAPGFQL
jgi:hypothetical protein